MSEKKFRFISAKLNYPLFFPDATRGFVKMLDLADVTSTETPGVLINTFHLWRLLEEDILFHFNGIREFMNWKGSVISDSGGFQVMSLIKKGIVKGKITDQGIVFYPSKNRKLIFTPEESIRFQMSLKTDLMVVLDDFTDPGLGYNDARESVRRTVEWAVRCKSEFERICKAIKLEKNNKPYLIGVVQGGEYLNLREECTKELVKIGFDGLGWGGWPFVEGKINFKSAEVISKNAPDDYILYGLGIGKPEDIVRCVDMGFKIFDCVLPTRDGRHGRLYILNEPIDKADFKNDFYRLLDIKKEKYILDKNKVSDYCDCVLCRNYSRAYLNYLFNSEDSSAARLASIHNLRFYSLLMNKLRKYI